MQPDRHAEVFMRDAESDGVVLETSDRDYLQPELTRAFRACRIDTILEVQDCVIKAAEVWERQGSRVPQGLLKHLLDSLPKEGYNVT